MRKRAFNKQELLKKECVVLTVPNKSILLVHEPKPKLKDDLTKNLDNQAFKLTAHLMKEPPIRWFIGLPQGLLCRLSFRVGRFHVLHMAKCVAAKCTLWE